ncbi:MAG: DUF547 domain-containing protein, partial [Saprospiraceae bacterium]
MKNLIILFAIAFINLASVTAQSTVINASFFDQTEQLLKANVSNGLVDYENLKSDKSLDQLIETIATAKIDNLDDATYQAFLINAYNLLVIKGAVDAYPLNSVNGISGFFATKKRDVAGQKVTLNKLEKEWLLKKYGDSRYHFVLVCGAVGCA